MESSNGPPAPKASANQASESQPAQASYPTEIRDEVAVLKRCVSYLLAKGPRLLKGDSTKYDEVELRRVFDARKKGGLDHDAALAETIKTARTLTVKVIRRAESIITGRCTKIESVYFSKLRAYGDRYGLTANAKNEIEIQAKRGVLLDADAGVRACLKNPASSSVDWSKAVEDYLSKIDEVAELASELSKQKLEWDKLIDDKRRLKAAIAGLWLAVVLSFITLAYDAYKDCSNRSGPSLCALVGWNPQE